MASPVLFEVNDPPHGTPTDRAREAQERHARIENGGERAGDACVVCMYGHGSERVDVKGVPECLGKIEQIYNSYAGDKDPILIYKAICETFNEGVVEKMRRLGQTIPAWTVTDVRRHYEECQVNHTSFRVIYQKQIQRMDDVLDILYHKQIRQRSEHDDKLSIPDVRIFFEGQKTLLAIMREAARDCSGTEKKQPKRSMPFRQV